jgi:hypothetical protein
MSGTCTTHRRYGKWKLNFNRKTPNEEDHFKGLGVDTGNNEMDLNLLSAVFSAWAASLS